jgi:signal transduction histidine kinase
MTPDTLPSEQAVLDEAALDAAVLQAAALGAYRHLAGHWLHALRGTLNATSLNLVVLSSSARPSDAAPRAWETLRGQVRELDRALTQLLDVEWLEESPAGRSELAAVVSHALALVEPLSRRRQLRVDNRLPLPGPWVGMDAALLFSIIFFLMTDAAAHLPTGSPLVVVLTPAPSGALHVHLAAARGEGGAEGRHPAALAATRRLLERAGGGLDRDVAPEPDMVTLTLPSVTVTGGGV